MSATFKVQMKQFILSQSRGGNIIGLLGSSADERKHRSRSA